MLRTRVRDYISSWILIPGSFAHLGASGERQFPKQQGLECYTAATYAMYVWNSLILYRKHIQEQLPDRTKAIQLIDQVLDLLRAEHHGQVPHDFLRQWCKPAYDYCGFHHAEQPEHEATLARVVERWLDRAALEREFWGLQPFHHTKFREPLTAKRIEKLERFLENWLKKTRFSPTYGT
ncbi:hypothetical protein VTO42DRAFT_4895 [Malbranchea cinnamomea]